MIDDDFQDIDPKPTQISYSSEHVIAGLPIPKQKRIQVFSPEEWEEFTEECIATLKGSYHRVVKFAGSGDMGLDIVGFVKPEQFLDEWDNFQCKHYDHPLAPSDIWVEIGKIIYYSYKKEYTVPRKYYFIAPKDIGTKLQKLLGDKNKLKEESRKNWVDYCADGITSTSKIKLEGELDSYFKNFDFGIFSTKSVTQLLEEHSSSKFHSVRFGGGLPVRPTAPLPPVEIDVSESRYIRQILDAYGDHFNEHVPSHEWVDTKPRLIQDFSRQRERFYHAESLRNFSRDTVPEGTFESLQDDIFQGVIDTCDSAHHTAYDRMKNVLTQSSNVEITSNPLLTVLRPIDKQGICHQLANIDRLTWMKPDE